MKKLFKFNQRAILVADDAAIYSFGIIISQTDEVFSFQLVNDKEEFITYINLNEWKISDILNSAYYTREKILFFYSDPNNSKEVMESGGRTINYENFNGILYLLQLMLSHFHRISCFEDIESVLHKKEQLENENKPYEAKLLNHKFVSS
jgi:hypothetical protein